MDAKNLSTKDPNHRQQSGKSKAGGSRHNATGNDSPQVQTLMRQQIKMIIHNMMENPKQPPCRRRDKSSVAWFWIP
ncbi:hypothetical protein P3T76_005042 [Phytophthora citrophthora]|uniref:Uncharacterized protein n=1 Tax=Phytophthora citrophthora TaxID=4793 RepID=A0AAD9GSE5_9STRA|nr:hypothetical protein P3T76_005042 [Phytophthora citrophthora]